MVACIIVALLSSFACLKIGLTEDDRKDHLEYELTKSEGISMGDDDMSVRINSELGYINNTITEIGIYTVVGYACYTASFLILKNIKKEDVDTKSDSKWDLKNFK